MKKLIAEQFSYCRECGKMINPGEIIWIIEENRNGNDHHFICQDCSNLILNQD